MNWEMRKPIKKPRLRDSVAEKIAKVRGIKDVERFLSPQIDELHDPYLMKNIEDACNKIIKAMSSGKRIVVSYDPDADGLTSATIMLRHLRNYYADESLIDYIYSERSHGHGIQEMITVKEASTDERKELNKENIKKIKKADLLILIDSSSNDKDACKFISENWCKDIIILDHHEIENDNPYALIVNPQQEGCEYPNKHLSGAGVVFKVIQVIEDTMGQIDPFDYIDLVAIGMYSDMMRVDIPENRYIIMQGLRNIKNAGILRILKGAKVDLYRTNGDTIGFTIAPILNGVARMDNLQLAIDILSEDDDNVCKKLRLKMDKLNKQKKEIQKEITKRYLKNINKNEKVLIVSDEQSSKGFNGVVAQNIVEIYQRPVMVGRKHKGLFSGSFRGIDGHNMKDFLQGFNSLFENPPIDVKGHPNAGGFSISEDRIDELMQYIHENAPEPDNIERTIMYDFEIPVEEIGLYVADLDKFNYLTGLGFPKLIVVVKDITLEDKPKVIGKTMETVKFTTLDGLELVKFRVNDQYAKELGCYDTIDAVGQLQMNEFYHWTKKELIRTPQVMIEDYKISE